MKSREEKKATQPASSLGISKRRCLHAEFPATQKPIRAAFLATIERGARDNKYLTKPSALICRPRDGAASEEKQQPERPVKVREMSYTNRFPPSKNTRYRSSWGPTSVSVFQRADVPRPSPEEEEYAEFYHERLHSAQSRQLIPLQEDLADWINKTISESSFYYYSRCGVPTLSAPLAFGSPMPRARRAAESESRLFDFFFRAAISSALAEVSDGFFGSGAGSD